MLDGLYETALREVTEIPALPLEVGKNKYGESKLQFQNPYSYIGYAGIIKDVERALGAGQDKAKEYELTPMQRIYDNAGLLFLVPSEDKAQQQKQLLELKHQITQAKQAEFCRPALKSTPKIKA